MTAYKFSMMQLICTSSFIIRFSLALLIAWALTNCEPKKEIVTTANRVEVLTRYGQEHQENEVIIETEYGNLRIRLYEDTPLHRANFIKLINEGHYEKADFYRIVPRFMIQGGDNERKLDYRLPAEFRPHHFHKRGALAMARFDENNPEKESSSTEFYVTQGQRYTDEDIEDEEKEFGIKVTPEQREIYKTLGGEMSLDTRYTVFGEVTEGFEVIDKIAAVRIHQVDKPMKKIPFRISTHP